MGDRNSLLTKIKYSGRYGYILTEITKPQQEILTSNFQVGTSYKICGNLGYNSQSWLFL